MATTKPAEPAADPRVDDLLARVEKLEQQLGGVLTGKVAELSQEEKDRRTLSRRPNSYPEAVEYEAAQQRQAERDKKAGKSDEPAEAADAATAPPSTGAGSAPTPTTGSK